MQGEIARAEELLGALGEKVALAARLIALVNEVLLLLLYSRYRFQKVLEP